MSASLANATAFNTGSTTSTTATVTTPTGAAAGDLLILYCWRGSSGTSWSAPGFTAVTALSASSASAQVLYRMLDGSGSDPGATFTVTASASGHWAGLCVRVTGAPSTGYFDVTPTSGQINASSATIAAPGITTVTDGDLLVWLGGSDGAGATPTTITVPSGYTDCGVTSQTSATSGVGSTVSAGSATQATAGATGTVSGTDSTAEVNGAVLLAVVSAATGTTGTGSAAQARLALAASGAVGASGPGSLAAARLGLGGSAAVANPTTGTGSLAAARLGLAASGAAYGPFTGSGSLALAPLALAASGAVGVSGTGSLALARLGLSGGVPSFPATVLDLQADLQLGGAWQPVGSYLLERSRPQIHRGRPDESSQVSAGSCTAQLSNRDSRFTARNPTGPYYPYLGRNTPFRLHVAQGSSYLRLEEDNSSYASCPSSAALNVAGDLELRIDLELTSWVSCILAAKCAAGDFSWAWGLNADATLFFQWTYDGSSLHSWTSSRPLPWPGGRISLKVTRTTAGALAFAYATSIDGTYTTLDSVSGSTGTLFASTQPLQVGYSAYYAALTGFDSTVNGRAGQAWKPLADMGVQGKVFEARLYDSGTLVADPVFSAENAGSTSFTDAQGNTWSLAGTAEISDRRYRYYGEVGEWPPKSDVSGNDVYIDIQANGLLRRAGQGTAPLDSALTREWKTKTGAYAPVAYWPVEDGSAATHIASGLPGGLPMTVSGSPSLGGTSPLSCTAAMGSPGTSTWTGVVPRYTQPATSPANVVRFLLSIPSGGDTDGAVLLRVYTTGTVAWYDVVYSSLYGGQFYINGYSKAGAQLFTQNTLGSSNGVARMMEAALTVSGGTITYHLNGLAVGASSQAGWSGTLSGSLGVVTRVVVNPAAANVQSSFGQFAVQNAYDTMDSATSADSIIGPLNAWAGETAGLRFARLCAENGYQARIIGPPSASVAMGPQPPGKTFLALLQECEEADHGMIFEPRDSLSLGYRTSASLTSQGLSLAGLLPLPLDYAAADLGGGGGMLLDAADDDQLIRNDVTVTRQAGTATGASAEIEGADATYAASAALSTAAPPDGVGSYQDARTISVRTDDMLGDQAGWLVHLGMCDELRFPAVPVDLARAALASLRERIEDIDIGDELQITSPPAWLAPDDIRAIVWGYTETIGGFIWTLQWQTLPASPYDVLVAGSGLNSDPRADTDGSTLAAGIGATDASFQVSIAAGYPLWITGSTGPDFPLDVLIGGERITVSGVRVPDFLTGDSATFDGSLGTWTKAGNSTIAQVASPTHNGTGALAITAAAQGNAAAASCLAANITTEGLPCAPGDSISVGAWVQAAATSRSIGVGTQFYDSSGTFLSTAYLTGVADATGSWTQIDGSVVAPASSAYCRLSIDVYGAAAGEVHYVDDAYLANLTTAPASPQEFVVTRSVNGVVKSHGAGEAVHIFQPVYVALT